MNKNSIVKEEEVKKLITKKNNNDIQKQYKPEMLIDHKKNVEIYSTYTNRIIYKGKLYESKIKEWSLKKGIIVKYI